MNTELLKWLDAATMGLPVEIKTRVRAELESHYQEALAEYQQAGEAPEDAHDRAMSELGEAADTANSFRRTHLSSRRHLAAFVVLCLVLCWFLLNGRTFMPNAYVSGSTRIIAAASMFTLFLGALWMLRDFLTRQLQLPSLRLPLNLQILGWGLTVLPFLREVLLARIILLNELLMTDYPIVQHRLYQMSEIISIASSLFVCSGLFLMAWRLAKVKPHLYGFGDVLRWVAFIGGLIFAYSFGSQLMNMFGVNFVVMNVGSDTPTQIGLIMRFQPMENALWLSSGINWLDALGQIFMVTQVALLSVMGLLFFCAYLHDSYWLKQSH